MSFLPDRPALSQLSDQDIRDELTRILFELELVMRVAALRDTMNVTLDLVERRVGDDHLRPYTVVIAHGLDCPHERTSRVADPNTGKPRVVCLDCKRWVE